MPLITKIVESKRRPDRRHVYLDGTFGFACRLDIVMKFGLREGMALSGEQVGQIRLEDVKQACFNQAMEYMGWRLYSRAELQKKLIRCWYDRAAVDAVLEDLERLGYLDDKRFAEAKALSAQHRHHGRNRALRELLSAGVQSDIANKVLADVYAEHGSTAVARQLAEKQAPRLRKLDPLVARRRLVGMLQRRGFDYDAIKPVVDELLGREHDGD